MKPLSFVVLVLCAVALPVGTSWMAGDGTGGESPARAPIAPSTGALAARRGAREPLGPVEPSSLPAPAQAPAPERVSRGRRSAAPEEGANAAPPRGSWTPRRDRIRRPRPIEPASLLNDRTPTWELVEELRDDDVRWNATAALGLLERRIRREPATRAEVLAAVEPYLDAGDAQLSTLATALALRIQRLEREAGQARRPSPRLLERALQWLVKLPRVESEMGLPSRYDLIVFAMEHVERLEPRLLQVLEHPAGRDPFDCAFVLGATGRRQHLELVAPVLLPHLRDNRIENDAVMAMEALQGLGPGVIPHLEAALSTADFQQRGCLEAVLLEFSWPITTHAEARARKHLTRRVTNKYHAPARSWRFRTSYERCDRSGGFPY